MDEDRYEECDRCGEGYDGEDTIRRYLRDVEIGEGIERVCIGCENPPDPFNHFTGVQSMEDEHTWGTVALRETIEAWIVEALAEPADCWICEAWGFTVPATSPADERPTCDSCRAMPLPLTSGDSLLVRGDVYAWGDAR